ncbi:hypothetical protein PHYSODRAFT_488787 [Phytophthora sojae]|uniref:Ubiquitin-like protease family profile domain-containing protein n=1 Tax=Phytophthora sojae (strain P6497) TaxID=1094619 RepID=G4ZCD1_PHYSP|nr:hypothetical protein PHYSODRAFT_488787 [Phytophthora sojae]EGZ22159.1 hypothetical protein PHYSODRAFT_488787 [Phytophthora sojae]|eukprot:XP_009524876.1 hypothetical protein PHYSODRAFT_488787 [Phytophthora sojae]
MRSAQNILDSASRDIVLIPVNCNNNHWCCIMINRATQHITFYDLLNSKYALHVRAVAHKLAGILRSTMRDSFFNVRSFDTDVEIQRDSYNCGVYVLLSFEHFTGAPCFGQVDKTTLEYLRYRYMTMCY